MPCSTSTKLRTLYRNYRMRAVVSQINDVVYQSGLSGISAWSLQEHRFTAVLNVSQHSRKDGVIAKQRLAYKQIKVHDNEQTDISQHFAEAIEFIRSQLQQKNGKVLVVCKAGRSRSSAVILAYLIQEEKMTLHDAYILLRTKRPCVRPNNHFFSQLIDFERKITGMTSVKMVQTASGKIKPDIVIKVKNRERSRAG